MMAYNLYPLKKIKAEVILKIVALILGFALFLPSAGSFSLPDQQNIIPKDNFSDILNLLEKYSIGAKTENFDTKPDDFIDQYLSLSHLFNGGSGLASRMVGKPVADNGRRIEVDLSSQMLYAYEGGKQVASYSASTGRAGMETPVGTFRVISKIPRLWSEKYGIYMPYFLQFTAKGHGIHELPEWPNGAKEGANHLGVPVSHGCVRLGVGPAKFIYDFASVGMPIVIRQ